MLANANPKVDTPSLNRAAREVAALCVLHEVPCGAPEDLANLLRALGENKRLAMEFWALVARLTDRDPAVAIHPDAMLAAIVEAVTGQTLAEANAAGSTERLLVRKFANMLAGEDIDAPMPAGPFTAARAREAAPEPEPPASGPLLHASQTRLVLEPDPPAASAQVDPDRILRDPQRAPDRALQDDPQIAIPLAAYADADANRSRTPRLAAAVVLLLAAAGGLWYAHHRNPAAWTRATQAWKPHSTSSAAGTSATQSPVVSPTQPSAAVSAAPSLPPAPVVPLPQASAQPAQSAAPEPATIAPALQPQPTNPHAERNDTESAASAKPEVVVPEAIMRQNLVSSRVPLVPGNVTRHGIVVLDAVITSRGTVEHLRAIAGDPALHRSAIDAASTWRYRPYLLNGTPVDVSTTIYVNFAGND